MKITKSYTNFIRIPIIKNHKGKIFTEPLWAKDILLHTNYIDHFNLCSPVEISNDTSNLEDITDYKINEIFPLRRDYGLLSIIKNIVPNFFGVLNACRKSEIVHSNGAGWAFPLSFYILLFRPFIKFQWIIGIESSFWLLSKNDKITFRKALSHFTHKILLRLCFKSANARIFTQSFYRKLFLGDDKNNALINPASWVNQNDLISLDELKFQNKSKPSSTVEFVYPSRLVEEKGVKLIFDAVSILSKMHYKANITIIGDGPLKNEVISFANKDHGNINVVYLEPVEYGEPFFNLLRHHDLVLTPNLKEEQPRIIFDAFSQGIGVIASNTSGIMDIVEAEKNAYIFDVGNANGLAKAMIKAMENPKKINQLGVEGLAYASGKTHSNMHKARLVFLQSALDL